MPPTMAGRRWSGPAGGQFNLCYRHHPDFKGAKPTHELIERLHREHLERQAAIHSKLHAALTHRLNPAGHGSQPPSGTKEPAVRQPARPAELAR